MLPAHTNTIHPFLQIATKPPRCIPQSPAIPAPQTSSSPGYSLPAAPPASLAIQTHPRPGSSSPSVPLNSSAQSCAPIRDRPASSTTLLFRRGTIHLSRFCRDRAPIRQDHPIPLSLSSTALLCFCRQSALPVPTAAAFIFVISVNKSG